MQIPEMSGVPAHDRKVKFISDNDGEIVSIARNFAIHCKWHPSVCDEQLLAAFSEDELSKLEDVLEKRILAQRASAICNAMNDNQAPKRAWVAETPADNRQYRSEWKGRKITKSMSFL